MRVTRLYLIGGVQIELTQEPESVIAAFEELRLGVGPACRAFVGADGNAVWVTRLCVEHVLMIEHGTRQPGTPPPPAGRGSVVVARGLPPGARG